jgi:pilus assembly protein CpaF
MDKKIVDQLKSGVENQHKILIGGRIEAGKTLPFSALRIYLPFDGRDLLIEFTSEIHMGQDNRVCFEPRQPQDGLRAVTLLYLLKRVLRHRPGSFILGDIRGGETFDFLQTLNSECSRSLSTVQASSSRLAASPKKASNQN